MKKFINNLVYVGFLAISLNFIACQSEFEEINGDQQETITANSSTAELIQKTSSNDGSFDNIVDGASCFAVQFPYTVEANGIEIIIDSREDLHTIEEIFDELDDDVDVLNFLFPITITLADFSEIVIENKERLIQLAEECLEGGGDDDIECIDFVYPITLFTFDINEQQTGEVLVESDEQLRKFFEELDENDLISIDFPLTLKKFDGTEIVVDSNGELAMALENAKDECDEDDDNDYNDDDFDEERFDFCLTECPWLVQEVVRDNVNNTDQYFEYLMTFTEDGGVTVKDRAGNVLNGTWSARFTDHGPLLTLEFDTLVDFNLEWLVYEIGEHTIKLYAEGGNKIIMKQLCEGGETDISALREILKECEWIIKKVINQGEEIERLLGYEFKFMPEGLVTLSNGISTLEGTWEVGLNSEQVLSLLITIQDEPGVSFDWPLRDLFDTRLRFEVEATGHELVLLRVCDDSAGDGDVTEIRNIMLGGPWNIALYQEGEMDLTSQFVDMDFNFSTMHQVEVSINDDPIAAGLWRILRDSEEGLKFYINFDTNDNLGGLTEDWKIVEVSSSRIELRNESGDGTLEILVFEKL
ncbi:hypothetical protein [Flagellimonas meishanensis]|uniref:hypothetical protein n=1 Tax=Flagellimonas meishanensis TaxID=2873264 RepID=UPI001CA7B019|nr:hypothetical protein [[Muricauda] meishanensis]